MERKTLKLEVKALSEPGTFTGDLAALENRDYGNDIIHVGAFTKTLKDHGGRVPFLESHSSWSGTPGRLGILNLSEAPKVLRVDKGVLNLKKQSALDAYADLHFYHENNMPLGLSIGYDAVKFRYETMKDGTVVRHLDEVALWEGSLVTFGMNPKALVTGVKNWGAVAGDIKALMEDIKAGTFDAARMDKLQKALNGLGGAIDQITALLELADVPDAGKGAATETSHEPGSAHSPATVKADWITEFRSQLN